MFGKKKNNDDNVNKNADEPRVSITKNDYDRLSENNDLACALHSENEQLKQTIKNYEKRLNDLEITIKNLQEKPTPVATEYAIEYHTDEEDLEWETQSERDSRPQSTNSFRQSVKRRRKDKLEPPKAAAPQKKEPAKPPMPPPINVSNVDNFNKFSDKILAIASSAKFKATSANDIKITVINEDEYRGVKRLLEEQSSTEGDFPGIVYHTYQLKSEKSFRAVIRGLPPTYNIEEITDEVKRLGHEPVKVTNIFKKIKNNDGDIVEKKFPLFLIELKQKENNKDIFNIKHLLHCKVTVEAPKQIKGIPQCINCQGLGHTKNFCTREAICVKCAGKHSTTVCTKKFNTAPKCALCQQEGHTANYKGCPIYQKKLKNQNQPSKSAVTRLRETKTDSTSSINPTNTGLSYAQVTKKQPVQPAKIQQKKEPSISDILTLLTVMKTDFDHSIKLLSNRMDKLENIPSAREAIVNKKK